MNSRSARRLILPATLAVTTLTVTALLACRDPNNEPYCEDLVSMQQCEEAEHCGWSEQFGECVNTCHEITDMAMCEAIDFCQWGSGESGGDTGDTGGGEGCYAELIT